MQLQRDFSLESNNEGVVSMQSLGDCYLIVTTAKGLAQCSQNEIVASMQP